MATKLASYHIPRAPGQNRSGWMMAVVENGVVDFTGGKYGRHSILADNLKRVNAHQAQARRRKHIMAPSCTN